jgi:photosystem II stability/assembly factor-like uncharacterized protein
MDEQSMARTGTGRSRNTPRLSSTWRLLAILGLMALLTSVPAQARGETSTRQEATWAYLGPPGSAYVTALAVAPTWPEDGTMVVIRTHQGSPDQVRANWGGTKDLLRTRAGGRTWEALPVPFDDTRFLQPAFFDFAPMPGSSRALFLLLPDGLLRSTDDGSSWELVHAISTDEEARFAQRPNSAQLALSPAFAQDQLAFLAANGLLYRTTSGGATWDSVDVPTDRQVSEVRFSPSFAQDGRIFLAEGVDEESDAGLRLGVLLSTDGGASWRAPEQELQTDSGPVREVSNLTVSPTFADDSTLFAVARGIADQTGCFRPPARQQSVLVRSTDGGESWQIVSPLIGTCGNTVGIGLSTAFGSDGIALVAVSSYGPSPASATCRILRTETWGEKWTTVVQPRSYESCFAPFHVAGSGQAMTALLHYNSARWCGSHNQTVPA